MQCMSAWTGGARAAFRKSYLKRCRLKELSVSRRKAYESDRNKTIANLPGTRVSLHDIKHKRYKRMFVWNLSAQSKDIKELSLVISGWVYHKYHILSLTFSHRIRNFSRRSRTRHPHFLPSAIPIYQYTNGNGKRLELHDEELYARSIQMGKLFSTDEHPLCELGQTDSHRGYYRAMKYLLIISPMSAKSTAT